MPRHPRSPDDQRGFSRYSVATQRAQGRTEIQPPRSSMMQDGSSSNNQPPPQLHGTTIKQEPLDINTDVADVYMTRIQTRSSGTLLCQKHKKNAKYTHRYQMPSSQPGAKSKQIHLKKKACIIRVKPHLHYIDEFSDYCVWGNQVTLYNTNVKNLRRIITSKKTPSYYYVCHMTKTFATPGKRMYFSTQFSRENIFPHMHATHDELLISNGYGSTHVMARLVKGLDDRATITTNWTTFFKQARMKEGHVYAFAFGCTSNGIRMTVYPI